MKAKDLLAIAIRALFLLRRIVPEEVRDSLLNMLWFGFGIEIRSVVPTQLFRRRINHINGHLGGFIVHAYEASPSYMVSSDLFRTEIAVIADQKLCGI